MTAVVANTNEDLTTRAIANWRSIPYSNKKNIIYIMKLKNFFPILFLLFSLNFYAQSEKMKQKKEQIKALKVAFLTTELDLTPNEAEKFWPIYNTYDDQQFDLRHQKVKPLMKKFDAETLDKMTEKEATCVLAQMQNADDELFLLRKKLFANLKGTIPAVKIIKITKIRRRFQSKIITAIPR